MSGNGQPGTMGVTQLAREVLEVKALDDACLDLPRILREKLSPSKILEKFIDDRFAEWLRSKLEPAEKARKGKAGSGKP